MKKYIGIIISIGFIFLLIGCSYQQVNDKEGYDLVKFTHTISKPNVSDDEFSRIEVEEDFYVKPKKVVTFSWAVADIINYFGIDTLEIELLGLPTEQTNIPNLINTLENTRYEDVGTLHVINYNKLKLLNPDLIILDGRTAGEYNKLKAEFPYTNILDASISNYNYLNQVKIYNNLGEIFPQINDQLNTKLKDFQTEFNYFKSITKLYRASVMMLNGNKVTYQKGENSRYGVIFREFGFLEAASEVTRYDEITSHGHEISLEFISDVNPEVIFLIDRNLIANNMESDKAFLKESKLLNVEAIKNDYIFNLNAEAWYIVTGGITATEQMIDDIKTFTENLLK